MLIKWIWSSMGKRLKSVIRVKSVYTKYQYLPRIQVPKFACFMIVIMCSIQVYIYPTPPLRARYKTRSILKSSPAGLKSMFSFLETGCLNKAKESNLHYYLPIAGSRTEWFMALLRALMQNETQIDLSIIWIRVADSISYDDNRYVKQYTGQRVKIDFLVDPCFRPWASTKQSSVNNYKFAS